MADPDEFTAATKRVLCDRANNACSNPGCRVPTSGPHTKKAKAIRVGDAAHIRGAHPGSKRYSPTMSSVQRRHPNNGVWLCPKCARLVDRDEIRYTVTLLYNWKRLHESAIQRRIEGKALAEFLLETELASFNREPLAAQQIVLDRPKFWEYLLAIELLRPKLDDLVQRWTDLDRGLITVRPRQLSIEQLTPWMLETLADVMALVRTINVVLNDDINAAWGAPGEEGQPIALQRAVDYLMSSCNRLLDHEILVKHTLFPDEFAELKTCFTAWTPQVVKDLSSLVARLSDAVDQAQTQADAGPKRKGPIEVDLRLVVKAPQGVLDLPQKLTELLERHKKRHRR